MAYLLKQIDLNQLCLGLAESKEAIPRNSNNTSLEVIKNEFHPIITKFKFNDDIMCDVCLGRLSTNLNPIVICDLCEAGVHQQCYGSELLNEVPSGDWFCQRCEILKNNNLDYRSIRCSFCPQLKGIMKNFNDSFWAHIACVKWIPDFDKIDEEVKNISCESYNLERNLVCCTFCNVLYGGCIQCDYDNCLVSFHVSCAQRKGIIPNGEDVLYLKNENRNFEVKIYCKEHESIQNKILFESAQDLKNIFSPNIHDFSCICKGFTDPLIKLMTLTSKSLKRKFAALDDSHNNPENSSKKVKLNDELQKDSKNKLSLQKSSIQSSEEKTQQTRIDSYMRKISVDKKESYPPATTSNLKEPLSAHFNFEEEKNNNNLNSFNEIKSKISIDSQNQKEENDLKKKEIFFNKDRNSNISKLFLTDPFSEEKTIEKPYENEMINGKKLVFYIEKKKLDRPKGKRIDKREVFTSKIASQIDKHPIDLNEEKELSSKKPTEPEEETLKNIVDLKKNKESIQEKTKPIDTREVSIQAGSENNETKELKIKKFGTCDETNEESTMMNQDKAANIHLNVLNEERSPQYLKSIEKEKINPTAEKNSSCEKKIKIKKKMLKSSELSDKSSLKHSENDQERKKLKKSENNLLTNCHDSVTEKIKVIINNEELQKDKEIKKKSKVEEKHKENEKENEKEKETEKETEKVIEKETDKQIEKGKEKNDKKALHDPDSVTRIAEEKNILDPKKIEKSRSESKTSLEKTFSNEPINQALIIDNSKKKSFSEKKKNKNNSNILSVEERTSINKMKPKKISAEKTRCDEDEHKATSIDLLTVEKEEQKKNKEGNFLNNDFKIKRNITFVDNNPNKTIKENKTESRKEDVNEKKLIDKKDEKNGDKSKLSNFEAKNDAIFDGDLMNKKMKFDKLKNKSGLTRLISGMDEVNTLILKKFKLDWIHYVDKKYNEPDINKVFENLTIN